MNAEQREDLRRYVSKVRWDLLRILEWIESELNHTGRDHHCPPPTIRATTEGAEILDLEDQRPLTDRHYWILTQLGLGRKLTRKDVMAQFGLGIRQSKRILGALSERGLIRFQRDPRPGYYLLCAQAGRTPDATPHEFGVTKNGAISVTPQSLGHGSGGHTVTAADGSR